MSPNAGGGGRGGVAGSQPMPMSKAVLYTRARINFGDLTSYLTYHTVDGAPKADMVHGEKISNVVNNNR